MVVSREPADIMDERTSPHPGGPHVGLRQGQRELTAPYNGENLGPCQQIPYLQPSQLYHNHDGRGRLWSTRPPIAILGPSTRNPQEDQGFIRTGGSYTVHKRVKHVVNIRDEYLYAVE